MTKINHDDKPADKKYTAGRKCSICTHKNVQSINRMVADGDSFRAISRQKLGDEKHRDSVRRHAESCLKLDTSMVKREVIENNHQIYSERLEYVFRTTSRMMVAIEDWLTDPANPECFDISPRDDEMTVIYLDHNDLFMGEPKRKKARLCDLLALAQGKGFTAVSVQSAAMDNRKLFLEGCKTFGAQLEQYGKYHGLYEKDNGQKNVPPPQLSNLEIARELYGFLINKHNVSHEDAIEVIEKDYPIEVKLIAKEAGGRAE